MEQVAEDRELLEELLAIFKTSFAEDLEVIRSGMEGDDALKVTIAAHSIKGASASLGIDGVTELARMIEDDGKAGRLEQARQRMDKLELLLREVETL